MSVIGNLPHPTANAGSGFATLDGQVFYRIAAVDALPPFFMNVVSSSDLWMYLSSRGGLTAGRVSADQALFPYDPVDRIHDAHHHSGPVSMCWLQSERENSTFWQPFGEQRPGDEPVTRNLYKNLVGNQVVFEEIYESSQLTFRAKWSAADQLGIVRSVEILNHSDAAVSLKVIDGFRNVLPWGIPAAMYQNASCLTDAYKRSECDTATGMGVFATTSGISDGTQPVETLRTNVVWSSCPAGFRVGLAADNLRRFQKQLPPDYAGLLAGQRGNYFVIGPEVTLAAGQKLAWQLVADVGLGHVELVELRERLLHARPTAADIDEAIRDATRQLARNVASADGLQQSQDRIANVHHFANVLFNNMRGGVFLENHKLSTAHFREFVARRNFGARDRHQALLAALPTACSLTELVGYLTPAHDPSLLRMVYEFLPISFSRRHGDPSRPWNKFSIRVKDAQGNPVVNYEGNWRDIFQNWEGLCVSFPEFWESVISKFVSGTTVDGFNPYRVTHAGLEWEEPDPDDPWSNIGYWGDHQIVYLLKLLEGLHARQPRRLAELLSEDRFAYINVPYRIKPYDDLVSNARESITYEHALAKDLQERVRRLGDDAKLLLDADGRVLHVNLAEKLLVPLLAKLSNFVVAGGIWMNTQRPEWNDANNALVGNGVSMVTLCYLRRYLQFCQSLFVASDDTEVQLSREVVDWLRQTQLTFQTHQHQLADGKDIADRDRRRILDELGRGFSNYRETVYAKGLSSRESVSLTWLIDFCQLAVEYTDHTIRLNHRDDALYHAYNLIELKEDELQVRHLYEMLEGQVAVLSSGALSAEESADLLDVMFLSRLFRANQRSFLLYPERELADFLDRNVIAEALVQKSPLMQKLVREGDRSILARDALGVYRFHADLRHAEDVRERLDRLSQLPQWQADLADGRQSVLDAFESVFQHHSYTGRSGTMYGYEGIGCIYWHMVSKLLLAVQESYCRAVEESAAPDVIERLAKHYYRVRDGLGPAKTPEEFGAFPTDPYSHTPAHAGARQPGMTGQVKEEILTRFGELGVRVRNGILEFAPTLLQADEFHTSEQAFEYFNQAGQLCELTVPRNGLAFTYCQVPIIYVLDNQPSITVHRVGEAMAHFVGTQLDETTSREVFERNGKIERIEVRVNEGQIRPTKAAQH